MKRLLIFLLLASCSRAAPQELPAVAKAHPQRHYVCETFNINRQKIVITLDAGHGGQDPGTQSPNKVYQEKNLALATTLLVRDYLQGMGYKIHLTRADDTFIPLTDRSKLANENHSDLFVSIHYNHSDSSKARGIEVFTFRTDKEGNRESEAKKMATSVLSKVTGYTAAPSRGVKQANFSVLRRTEMPAILIEGGFLSNEEELRYLKDPKYINTVAWGIAHGIDEYVQTR